MPKESEASIFDEWLWLSLYEWNRKWTCPILFYAYCSSFLHKNEMDFSDSVSLYFQLVTYVLHSVDFILTQSPNCKFMGSDDVA